MKTRHLTMFLVLIGNLIHAQSRTPVEQAVEGGKVLVELIKVFSSEKDDDADTGCRGRYADLCVANARDTSLTVSIMHRGTDEKRELVIARDGKECSLQLPIGVWTYDLKLSGTAASIRKGDLLIEGCSDVTMTIR
jgi:hypothetical protein